MGVEALPAKAFSGPRTIGFLAACLQGEGEIRRATFVSFVAACAGSIEAVSDLGFNAKLAVTV